MKTRIHALQIAEFISIKKLREKRKQNIFFKDNDEIFYAESKGRYLYVFKYGAVCFLGYTEKERKETIKELLKISNSPLSEPLEENISITTNAKRTEIGFNNISILKPNNQLIRLVMLHVTQSVALDYYSEKTEYLLEDTKGYISQLEKTGSLHIKGKNLKKYIGRTMNLKNLISENLYILDAPEATWEDEYLDKLDTGLKKTFDIKNRYDEIIDDISIIKENLELFKDIMQHKEMAILEWIIIILILVEVVDTFVIKFI